MQVIVKGFEAINLMGVKGVLLDIDNTLYPYQPSHEVAQKTASEATRLHLGTQKPLFEKAYQWARAKVHHDLDGQAASHSRLLYGQKLAEYLLGYTDFETALLFEQVYWDAFLPTMQLLPSAALFLRSCQDQQVKICLVTDLTAQIQHRKALALGLDQFKPFMVTSEEAGVEKPNQRMFNLALEKLNLSPAHCIMVGDSQAKDIDGATDLGIRAYKIDIVVT